MNAATQGWVCLLGVALLPLAACSGEDAAAGADASQSSGDGGGRDATASVPGDAGGPASGSRDAAPHALDGSAVIASDAGGLGAAVFDGAELDAPSHGGTITFQDIGAEGWYPSRRDPATGPCDAYDADGCCMAVAQVTSDALTPWDQDLVLSLRGPMQLKQLAVYQTEASGAPWRMVSSWDARSASGAQGLAFQGDGIEAGFGGAIGTECLVDVSTDQAFACGEGSTPYCPASRDPQQVGWAGSKLFVVLAVMPHADAAPVANPCSDGTDGNWWDAPWIGLSLGELTRAGAFSSCHCYAKSPAEWWLADGCGQFNVFEVVNDNNAYRNLDVFSTNMFGYAGYVGEGPCGAQCDLGALAADVDLVDKSDSSEAQAGAVANPTQGPGAAFRRPAQGYRYFLVLLHVPSRSVQLALVHPQAIPTELAPLLPDLPGTVPAAAIDQLLALRLPR